MPSTDLLNPVTPVLGGAALSSANAIPVKVISGGGSGITVDTTTITGGTTTRLLYDNGGTVGETAAVTYASASVTLALSSLAILAFLSSASAADLGISRVAAGSLAVGTGAQGSSAGKILASQAAFSNTVTFGDSGTWGTGGITLGSNLNFAGTNIGSVANIAYSGALTGTTAQASAIAIGPNGQTTPVFAIDASVASAAAGLKITGAAAGGTVALVAIDSAAATNVSLDAKGTGTLTLNGTATGSTIISRASFTSVATTTFTAGGTITYGGVTWGSAVTGTGSNVLATAPALTGNVTLVSASATGILTAQNGVAASASVATTALLWSSTASFGIQWAANGSVVPTIAATQGSLFINTTGSSTAARIFVRGSAAWIAVTTAS